MDLPHARCLYLHARLLLSLGGSGRTNRPQSRPAASCGGMYFDCTRHATRVVTKKNCGHGMRASGRCVPPISYSGGTRQRRGFAARAGFFPACCQFFGQVRRNAGKDTPHDQFFGTTAVKPARYRQWRMTIRVMSSCGSEPAIWAKISARMPSSRPRAPSLPIWRTRDRARRSSP